MKTRLWLLALVGAILLSGSAAWADGEFYVVVAGGGVGTKITSVPYEIKNPGFYYLGGNLTMNTGTSDAIIVDADGVTLDLMGFSLEGIGGSALGINMKGASNVEVRNGTVRSFYAGIGDKSDGTGANCRIINVRAFNNYNGIYLYGKNSLVRGCNCSSNTTVGIYVTSGTVTGNVACDNGDSGIQLFGAGSVIGNIANNNPSYNFIFWPAANILVDRNSASGLTTNYVNMTGKVIPGVNAGTP